MSWSMAPRKQPATNMFGIQRARHQAPRMAFTTENESLKQCLQHNSSYWVWSTVSALIWGSIHAGYSLLHAPQWWMGRRRTLQLGTSDKVLSTWNFGQSFNKLPWLWYWGILAVNTIYSLLTNSIIHLIYYYYTIYAVCMLGTGWTLYIHWQQPMVFNFFQIFPWWSVVQ